MIHKFDIFSWLKDRSAQKTENMVRDQRVRDSLEQYKRRLLQIDELEDSNHRRGPQPWNISAGQTDFIGKVEICGKFCSFVMVNIDGPPTSESNRERGDHWETATEDEIWSQVEQYEVTFLRRNDTSFNVSAPSNEPLLSVYDQRSLRKARFFRTYNELKSFLEPLNIEWLGALETFYLMESEGWSPDWGGD